MSFADKTPSISSTNFFKKLLHVLFYPIGDKACVFFAQRIGLAIAIININKLTILLGHIRTFTDLVEILLTIFVFTDLVKILPNI